MSENKEVDVQDLTLAAKVASLALSGVPSKAAIARQLGVSAAVVNRIVKSDEYRDLVAKSVDRSLVSALDDTRTEMAKLSREAVRVIAERLKDNDLDAAKMVLKGIGLDNQEDKLNDGSITIVMPGAKDPLTVDTTKGE